MNINRKTYDIFDLITALQHKEESDLTRKDRNVIQQFYTDYLNMIANKKTGIRLSNRNVEEELEEIGLYKEAEAYSQRLDRSYEFDYKVVENALRKLQKNNLSYEQKKNINIFKTLLKYKDKTITLTELYEAVYRGLMSASELKEKFEIDDNGSKKFVNPEDGFDLLKDINGCFSESVAAEVDMSCFTTRRCNIKDIRIDQGTYNNPRIFISGLRPSPLVNLVSEFDDTKDVDINFLVISDLHLASPVTHNYDGNINDSLLEDEFERFSKAKDVLFARLKRKGIKLSGLVFAGDIIDAGGGRDAKSINSINYVYTRKSEYVNKFIEFCKRTNGFNIPSKEEGGPEVVLFIPGNHDMRIGHKNLEKIVGLFRDDVVNLEGGSARFQVGNDLVSVSHPTARDWGIDLSFRSRIEEVKATFHLKEYFDICSCIYDSLEDREDYSLEELLRLTDKKIKEENPTLYKYYEPYITSKTDKYDSSKLLKFIDERIKIEDSDLYEELKPLLNNEELDIDNILRVIDRKLDNNRNSDIYKEFEPLLNHPYHTFFSDTKIISIDPESGRLVFNADRSSEASLGKLVGGYDAFFDSTEGKKVAESLKCNITQYVNQSRFAPILSILGHFHISNDSINKFWEAEKDEPVIVRESSSKTVPKTDRYYMETNLYTLKIKSGTISNINVTPYSVILNKEIRDGQISYKPKVLAKKTKEYQKK